MTNLKQLLTRPLRPVPTNAVVFLFIVALIGFADATYLAVKHYQGVIPPCSIIAGCELVLTSPYALILGIPVSLLGSIYYFLVLVGVFAYLEGKHEKLLRFALLFTIVGFVVSLWFVYVQIFIIHSYCAYCLVSAITSVILFVTAMELLSKFQVNNQ